MGVKRKYSISYKIRLLPTVTPRQRARDAGEGTEGLSKGERGYWDNL